MVEFRLFNTSKVCYRLPAHKNFTTTTSKHAKWRKKTLENEEGNFVSTDGLVIKHSVKKNYAYLIEVDYFSSYDEGQDLDAHLRSSRNLINSHFIFIFATH